MVREFLRIASRWFRPTRAAEPDQRDRALVAEILEGARKWRERSDRDLAEARAEIASRVAATVAADRDAVSSEIFPLVYEAARRALGVELYEVQLLAGLALSRGVVAEMLTGEGKTLTTLLPAAYFALAGQGVHVMTVNAYLARRDSEILYPALGLLGYTVGSLDGECPQEAKREAYGRDITFGPGYEFGFDYLRDQAALVAHRQPRLGESLLARRRGVSLSQPLSMQRGLAAAIVDEADSVLLDEATTPLILAVGGKEPVRDPTPYLEAREFSQRLVAAVHFTVDSRTASLQLTHEGAELASESARRLVGRGLTRPWASYVESALRATHLFQKDTHYVVSNGEVRIVDPYTGRIFDDRSWRDGLQQAVQAKEGVTITGELRSVARVTRQRFLARYPRICGMTGTARGAEQELKAVYGRDVMVIPPHRPSRRQVLPWRIFSTSAAKLEAIAQDVVNRHRLGQPVLIGAPSIEASRKLAERLDDLGIIPQVLNGVQDAAEAEIVALAGQKATVTVATNMAGRGTDIRLGPRVAELGGLHVVVAEPQESTRVDRQLIGRGARQGDPGSSQVFASPDDSLFKQYSPELARRLYVAAESSGGEVARTDELTAAILDLQAQVERRRAQQRQEMFAHDDWLEKVLGELA